MDSDSEDEAGGTKKKDPFFTQEVLQILAETRGKSTFIRGGAAAGVGAGVGGKEGAGRGAAGGEEDGGEAGGIKCEDPCSSRKELPIYLKESEIIDFVSNNLITIVTGATGSGKSTQLPQFLVEAGYSEGFSIVVTQPRRIAAKALAERVAEEMGGKVGDEVGYQVRYEGKVGEKTRIKVKNKDIEEEKCLIFSS